MSGGTATATTMVTPVVLTGRFVRLEPLTVAHAPAGPHGGGAAALSGAAT